MNERLTIRLFEGDQRLRLNSLTNDGVMLRNETDATPRALVLEFDGDNSVTKFHMDRVRKLRDWQPFEFKLNLTMVDGDIVVTGVDARALPAGRYWFRLRIADLRLPKDRQTVEIKEDKESVLELKAKKDKRDIRLTGGLSTFDPEMRRILEAAQSRLDGSAAWDWLNSKNPRARRKACLLNLLAKLRTAPTVSDPLIHQVQHVFFADTDRAYVRVDREFFTRIDALARDPKKPFFPEGRPKSSGHRRLLDRISSFEGDIAQYELMSYRQEGKNSMQAVIAHVPNSSRNVYADLDIDLGNPLQDVVGFVVHLGELIDPGRTDHLALREKLGKTKTIAPFLFYDVVDNT